ncbi:MAG TPA: amidohydrolase [Gaiellaceae bacterium]|nr:amidohydrolase [Gaiellaceae bacterium]
MSVRVAEAVEAGRPVVERISAEVWDLAELSLEEHQSAKVHVRELEAAGFEVVATGTAGVETAFLAEKRFGDGPIVGFLSEYDALPGLGNEAVPRQQPRADGKTSGHGCGHNLLGAALTGAAIATASALEASGGSGIVRVYGCAAEEAEGAKVYMARDGLFDDVDACLHWHPWSIATVMNMRLAAVNAVRLAFHGRTAHAGMEPWSGRSALDALELAAHAINLMREHIEPTARTHYIYEEAGEAPNVVPDYARMLLLIRDIDRAHVVATTEWVKQIAEGAALATQTRADVDVFFGMYDLLPNTPLAERMHEHLAAVGVPAWTDDEQAFARECQANMGLPEHGLATNVVPLQPESAIGGSSDVADVSWNAPTMGVVLPTVPLGVSMHTWAVTACGGMSIGLKAALAATEVLTRTALDVLTDSDLRAAARADFERRTDGIEYVSPIPPDQKGPRGYRLPASPPA